MEAFPQELPWRYASVIHLDQSRLGDEAQLIGEVLGHYQILKQCLGSVCS